MPITTDESEKRQAIIDACRRMNELGINQGTSGNISLRHQDGMLITPTSVPYDQMRPEQIVFMKFDGSFAAGQKPSSEWRFHLDILRSRSEVNAVVHAHPPYATILSIMGLQIPPIHYMIAAAGGDSIRCAPYATYWHRGIVRPRHQGARRPVCLPARPPRHDRDRTVACASALACRRGRGAVAAISWLSADRHTALAVASGDRARPPEDGGIWTHRSVKSDSKVANSANSRFNRGPP